MSMQRFKPAWWLPTPHLQTIWPVLCRGEITDLPVERERLELPDGDFIDLDWVGRNKTGPLIIILHGLEGSIESHYAKGMLQSVVGEGWRGLFMHFRGCSGEHNRLPRNYHSGDTDDVNFVVETILQRQPATPLAAVGFSLGGNVLLKWLGETGRANPLHAAVAISVPFELNKAAQHITKGFSRFYQWYFIRCLRERLASKFDNHEACLHPSILDQVHTMYEFDNHVTAPLHGFSNADEYYSASSSRQFLDKIQVPTLILHAKDDPFMSPDVIPEPTELSKNITLELTEFGGHVGFVGGKYPWRPEYWLEERVPDYLHRFIK